MSKYYCVSNIVFTSCHPVLIDSHANRKCRAETLTESHVKKHIPADEVGVVLPPCILVRVRHIYDVCTALTISRCCLDFRSQARPSEQSWMAFLLPLTRLVCQHYCAYGLVSVFPGGPAAHRHAALQAGIFAYADTLEKHTHANCLLSFRLARNPMIPADSSRRVTAGSETKLNKGRLSQVGHMSPWRHRSFLAQQGDSQFCPYDVSGFIYLYAPHTWWYGILYLL